MPEQPMPAPPPVISVIVAVHNVAGQVVAAIASLQAQQFQAFEALVIDDGSTDGSGALAAAAWGDDPRFRLIRQDNRGLSGARNAGLALARGAFVAFLDGDDAYAPAFLQTLHEVIERDGTDWAASAMTLCYPGGAEVAHPAVHAADAPPPAQRFDLTDARTVARLFPSAWNKLYRRAALGDLRFVEGSWFEDHEYYWACAARCPVLSYVPAPLYRHRRDRDGQITGTDSDRVFEQFAVLDRLHPVVRGGAFTDADAGFARLATRLIHERAMVVMDRPRRARFIAAARDAFRRWDLPFSPDWDGTISRGLAAMMQGRLPLSVVVIAGDSADLGVTLAALARQSMADFDLHVIARDGVRVPERLACGLPVQRSGADPVATLGAGSAVLMFNAGERPVVDGLLWLVNLIEGGEAGVPLAVGAIERETAGYHDGWVDNTCAGRDLASLPALGGGWALGPAAALRLHPVLGNRCVRRDVLARLDGALTVPTDAMAVQAYVLATALAAGRIGYTRLPVAFTPDVPEGVAGLRGLADWARTLPEAPGAGLPPGWRGTLFLRLARFRGGGVGSDLWTLVCALWFGLARTSAAARPDPETPRLVRYALWFWPVRWR